MTRLLREHPLRRPHRQRQRRRVIDAVANHDNDASLTLLADDLDLLGRCALGIDSVDADRRGDGLRHIGMVPGDHHHAADPSPPQPRNGTSAVGAERVHEHHRTDQHPVDTNEHVGEALEGGASAHARRPGRHRAGVGDIGSAADHHAASGHASAHAAARILVNILG